MEMRPMTVRRREKKGEGKNPAPPQKELMWYKRKKKKYQK